MKKIKDLTVILFIYVLAFALGYFSCLYFENIMLRLFMFDTVATVVTFVFSVSYKNSSVYDAYWSVTPMIMSVWLFIINKAFAPFQILFLVVFNVWSIRLTANWITVFTDFSYEDWRYKKFRDETPKIFWPLVNFFGIHYMPTLVVFLGMLPLFRIAEGDIGILSVAGILVMLWGIGLEFFADRQMHGFLNSTPNGDVLRVGLWKYSRHPNYLGEISFWLGAYLSMLPYAVDYWYYGCGFLSIALLFNIVSIPLMEKRQLSRRPQYSDYKKETSRLLLWKKRKMASEK
ncbi:MAG: DUF1295 domain-containing protein [Lachnospiraceae bacterium]|nr:DUF1295 domain-containing protein [Lachnospiraceae bacterium]